MTRSYISKQGTIKLEQFNTRGYVYDGQVFTRKRV